MRKLLYGIGVAAAAGATYYAMRQRSAVKGDDAAKGDATTDDAIAADLDADSAQLDSSAKATAKPATAKPTTSAEMSAEGPHISMTDPTSSIQGIADVDPEPMTEISGDGIDVDGNEHARTSVRRQRARLPRV